MLFKKFKMAGVNSQRVTTRSRKTTTACDISETQMHKRLTRSSKNTPSDVGTSENGALSEMELEKKSKEAVVLRTKRKRRRIDSDSENDDKEDEITEAKVQFLTYLFTLLCMIFREPPEIDGEPENFCLFVFKDVRAKIF